jgi:hypothetical protein
MLLLLHTSLQILWCYLKRKGHHFFFEYLHSIHQAILQYQIIYIAKTIINKIAQAKANINFSLPSKGFRTWLIKDRLNIIVNCFHQLQW